MFDGSKTLHLSGRTVKAIPDQLTFIPLNLGWIHEKKEYSVGVKF